MNIRRTILSSIVVIGAALGFQVVTQPHFQEKHTGTSIEVELGAMSRVEVLAPVNTKDLQLTLVSYLPEEKLPKQSESFDFLVGGSVNITGLLAEAGTGIPGYVFTYTGQLQANTLRFIAYPKGKPITMLITSMSETPFTIIHSWDENGFRAMTFVLIIIVTFGIYLWARSALNAK